ncbi:MAG: T9SS type A sorting domain-containing protein [Endomicrobiales bacterium]|nr:T9SS type A sorting domain-containing protein [Endomicrobiales bacterium]
MPLYADALDTSSDDAILASIEKHIFNYFNNEINSGGYSIQDRARNFETDYPVDDLVYTAIASGFGMVAACIGHSRGLITKQQAYDRVNNILTHYLAAPESSGTALTGGLVHHNGFFYHFTKADGSRSSSGSELSTIDTAFFIAGALFAGQYFLNIDGSSTLWNKADTIYKRINWNWMRNGGSYLKWAWQPETGFAGQGDIAGYSEGIFAYILAMGSPTYPLTDTNGWSGLSRTQITYRGLSYVFTGPLFTHQYPGLFVKFSGMRDNYMCIAANNYKATLHNHRYTYDNRAKYSTYGKNSWGIGATDDPNGGYTGYGIGENEDGTIAISNLLAAITELPSSVIDAIKYLNTNYASLLWGTYGFCDSYNKDSSKHSKFNVSGMWRDPDVIGIQSGAGMIAIENYRSGFVKNTFSAISYIQNGLSSLGFTQDSTLPGKIREFEYIKTMKPQNAGLESLQLRWLASGDNDYNTNIEDGIYEIRFSTNSADTWESAPANYLDFDVVWSTNAVANQVQTKTLSGLLDFTTYYFLIKVADKAFNWSSVSEKLRVFTGAAQTIKTAFIDRTIANTITLYAERGDIVLNIPAGTFSQDVNLTISTAAAAQSYEQALKIIAVGFGITNDKNLQPQKPIIITVNYFLSDVIDGNKSQLTLARYDQSLFQWIVLPSTLRLDSNQVVSSVDHLSNFALVQISPAQNLSEIRVFPNPYYPKVHLKGLTFDKVPQNASIKIYTINGELVREVSYVANTGSAIWNGKNSNGEYVASGVYIALINSNLGKKIIKIAVER